MGTLHIKAVECTYKEHGRQLKEQFINGIDVEEIMQEIIKELMTQSTTEGIDNEHVLMWLKELRCRGCRKGH